MSFLLVCLAHSLNGVTGSTIIAPFTCCCTNNSAVTSTAIYIVGPKIVVSKCHARSVF